METDTAKVRAIPLEDLGANTVEALEEVLARARRGELSSVAIAYVTRDGMTGHAWSAIPTFSMMIGAVRSMEWTMMRDWFAE